MVAVAYQNILDYEYVIDDIGSVDQYKQFNDLIPFFKSPAESTRSLMYLLMYNAGHGAPWPFHLVSLIFHLGDVLLIYLIISKMIHKNIAFLTALLAAIHPIFVESVTWISGSPYVEYSFFCLLSLYFYMHADKTISFKKETNDKPAAHKDTFNKTFYIASLISFVIATLLSEKAIVFPLLLVTYEIAFGSLKKNWLRFIPFITVSCLWVLFYIPMAQKRITDHTTEYHLEKGFDNPLIQIPVAITSYLQLIFWPDKLSIYHSELRFGIAELILRGAILAALSAGIFLFYKKNRVIFFCLAWFILSLLPTLLPIRLSWIFAERYVYLGAMGILTIVSLGIYEIFKRKSYRTLGAVLVVAIISGLLMRTYVRNLAWKTEDDLWLATADASPSDFKTHNNVGTVYMKQGDIARAEREFIIAISMNKHYADAYYNLALLYMNYNVFDRAERFYLQAIKEKPTFWEAYNGLSIVYIGNKQFDRGEQYAKKTIELKPDFPGGYNNLGLVYQVTNRPKEAIPNFKKAIAINPALWQTHFNLALLYHLEQDPKNVEFYIQEAFKNGEDTPAFYNRLAQVYMTMKRTNEAKQALSKSLSLNPGDEEAQQALESLSSFNMAKPDDDSSQ